MKKINCMKTKEIICNNDTESMTNDGKNAN